MCKIQKELVEPPNLRIPHIETATAENLYSHIPKAVM
jgi:hypothetical protein